jgi:hypothetical protein
MPQRSANFAFPNFKVYPIQCKGLSPLDMFPGFIDSASQPQWACELLSLAESATYSLQETLSPTCWVITSGLFWKTYAGLRKHPPYKSRLMAIPVVELGVDRLSATGAAFLPWLTVFWDTSHVVEKDHHLDEVLTPLNVVAHIAPRESRLACLHHSV